jgi:hypothetical protein
VSYAVGSIRSRPSASSRPSTSSRLLASRLAVVPESVRRTLLWHASTDALRVVMCLGQRSSRELNIGGRVIRWWVIARRERTAAWRCPGRRRRCTRGGRARERPRDPSASRTRRWMLARQRRGHVPVRDEQHVDGRDARPDGDLVAGGRRRLLDDRAPAARTSCGRRPRVRPCFRHRRAQSLESPTNRTLARNRISSLVRGACTTHVALFSGTPYEEA